MNRMNRIHKLQQEGLRCPAVRISKLLCLCIVLLLNVVSGPASEDESEREYRIKAAFIYNFIRFTKWPDEAESSAAGKPVVIGVLGDNPFGESGFQAVENEIVPSKNRKLVVKQLGRYVDGMDVRRFDLLFISASEKGNFDKIINSIGDAHVMTVSDTGDFIEHGGMINLVIKDRNIRWELNAAAVKKSALQVNSQLYRSAIRVADAIRVVEK